MQSSNWRIIYIRRLYLLDLDPKASDIVVCESLLHCRKCCATVAVFELLRVDRTTSDEYVLLGTNGWIA